MKYLRYILILFLTCLDQLEAQEIRLIVRSDDIGFCHTANVACMEVFSNGISRSVEIMAPAPWLMEAIKMLQTQPKYDVGVHLVLTSEWENLRWRPLTHAPSLVDKDGYFPQFIWENKNLPQSDYLLKHSINLKEVEAEFRAQIELIMRYLPNQTSHLTAHMGCSNANKEITDLVSRLSIEYKLPISLPIKTVPIKGFSGANKSPEQKEQELIKVLESLVPGTHYLVEHPGYDGGDMKTIGHVGYENVAYDREGVTRAFTSEAVKKIIKDRNIQLLSIGEVLRF